MLVPRLVLLKAFVLSVSLDAGGTVEWVTEADVPGREVRLVVILVLATEEAADGARLIAMGLDMGIDFGAAEAPWGFVACVTVRAFKDSLFGAVR